MLTKALLKQPLLVVLLIVVLQGLMLQRASVLAQQGGDSATPHPVVAVQQHCLLGGTLKGKWLRTSGILPMLRGGESYRIYNLSGAVVEATGERPESEGTPCEETYNVKFSGARRESEGVIAIGGDWNALPRVPRQLSPTTPVYQQAVATFLRSKGIARPEVKIERILSIDLEGDGQDEVLINATRYSGGLSPNTKAGDYSFILLRKIVGGRVRSILVSGEFYPRARTFNAPNQYTLGGVFDVDGDGQMEIVAASQYYEGEATAVYRVNGGRVGVVLDCGCGV